MRTRTTLLAGLGLLVAVLAAAPAAAADPPPAGYTDNGTSSDGYHQIALSPGGEPPPAETSGGTYRADVSWTAPDGLPRSYRVIVPPGLPATAPYVVAMGGLYLPVSNTQSTQGWDAYAEQHRFVVVYAQGYGSSLNAGVCCGYAAAHDVDDVGYLVTTLGHVNAQWPRDPLRTDVAGFSNGAMMAYRFACERSDLVAAIGVAAGTNESDCTPNHGQTSPVAVRHVHGRADTTVPYDGTDNASVCSCPITPVPPVLASWERTNRDVAPVEATLVDGMGHRWPRAADGYGIDATELFLGFFAAHPKA